MVETRRVPIGEADPYLLFGLLGKQVIHPGGRKATEELLGFARMAPGQQVLDIGCGAATTAIEMASRFGVTVTAADISADMRDRAIANVDSAGLAGRVSVEPADICALQYEDGRFDRVVAEAVTMFVDRDRAIRELVRVCRPGGLVLATEFHWRRPPTTQARQSFLGELCPGMLFETVEDWLARYGSAGLVDLQVRTGPFEMMTARGFISDEGIGNSVRVMARAMLNGTARRRMRWIMPRVSRAVPYLGYVVICGRRPAGEGDAS
ncbi:MAG: class I SAM-dependent methyltransferase [Chloroflexi bacterium]|nr:MAG: class I SAM-dependent methyltransferase [Chloroflexota bacterium]